MTIGRFRIEAPLGQGGMGTVYKAWDTVLERRVALKSIRLGAEESQAHVDRFRREALLLAQLNHSNVCQVHDWLVWEGRAFIAMEFIEGATLAQAAETMDLRAKLKAIRSIASALEAAHSKGIVHRDLKPSNVMVDSFGQVKVLDFGVARLTTDENHDGPTPIPDPTTLLRVEESGNNLTSLDSSDVSEQLTLHPMESSASGSFHSSQECLTLEGCFVGSPAYASPEQMLGRKVGPPSDIFSLGVLAWNLLLGDHPFPGEGRARMEATVDGRRKSLKRRKLPRRVSNLLRAMLTRDPTRRPTAGMVADAIKRQLAPSWTRWWIALAASTLGALGLAYLVFGRGVIADLVRERPPRLAVMPIRNETGNASLNSLVEVGMTELLATALRESPKLSLVESESLQRAFNVFRLDPTRALDPAQQGKVVKALGVALVLQGTLRREPDGRTLVFSYSLMEPSGNVRLSGSVTAPAQAEFTTHAFVDPAAVQVLHKVDPLRSIDLHPVAAPPEAITKYAEGRVLFLKGDFKGSEPLLREAAMQAPAFSMAVAAYAACLRRLGEEKATDVANWALMSARATGDRWAESQALSVKAYLAKDRGDLNEAEFLRKSCLIIAQSTRNPDGEAIALNHLGIIAAERNQNQEARHYYEQSLRLNRQVTQPTYISLTQNNLANLAMKQGDVALAAEMYTDNLAVQREIGNRWGEALALNNLGVVTLTSQDLAQAEKYLNQALAIRESVGDKAGQATSLRNLGILQLMKGDLVQSNAYHARAMQMAQAAGIKAIEAECSFCIGELHRLEKRFPLAMQDYRRTLELLPKQVMPSVRTGAVAALAECEARSSRTKEALRLMQEIDPAHSNSPYVHRAKAWIHFQNGALSQALDELAKAQADPHKQAPDIQTELASTRILFQKQSVSAR